VGVAHRGQIPLESISARLQVRKGDFGGTTRFGVKETVILRGSFNEQQLKRLGRTVDYCPRGQEFTKQVLEFEDHIEFAPGPATSSVNNVVPSPPDLSQVLVPGTVEAQYLPGTQEASEDVFNEGEVKLYFSCETKKRPMRWNTLAGHTCGWCPLPVHLTNGGLAASIVATIRQIVSPVELSPGELEVVVEAPGRSGGKAAVQAAAESGSMRKQHLVRKIFLGGPLRTLSVETIQRALENDPLCRYYADGNILLDKEIIATGTPRPR
jgi:hypothetical protein